MWPLSRNQSSKGISSSKANGSSKDIPQPSSKPSGSNISMPFRLSSRRGSTSSGGPITRTTTPIQTTSGRTPPPPTQTPEPSLQQQHQEEQLPQPERPRPHTPHKKRASGASTASKRSSGQITPSSAKGHAYTTSAGSGTSLTGFGRWGRRSLPSPPESVAGNTDINVMQPGDRRSWGGAETGELSGIGKAEPPSEQRRSWGTGNGEEKGFGRVASKIKAAVLGGKEEEGDRVGRKKKGGSADGSLGGSRGGSLGGSLGGSKAASASGSKVGSQVGSAVGSKVGSVNGRAGWEGEGNDGVSPGAGSPVNSPTDSDGEAPKPVWGDKVKGRRKRSQRWRAKKVDENAMPPGMVTAVESGRDRPWGRRAIWRRGKIDKDEEGEKKKKVGGFVTMMDASPAPIRLPSYEKLAKKRDEKREKEETEDEKEAEKEVEDEELEDELEEEIEEGTEEDEWDEDSLLRLSDWWRQMLGKGKDPTWQELDMMNDFLSDLYEEDTPSLEMILTTRLHKLLEALIKAAGEQGLRYEGKRFRKMARKATEIRDKWMDDMDGELYNMRAERREMLKGVKGRLSRVYMRPAGEHSSRWVVEGPCVEEGIEFEPGMWWLNDACAERDGMLTDTRGNVSVSPQAIPVVTLAFGEEMPTQKPAVTRFTHSGRIETTMLPLLLALDKRVQVLRRFTLKSRLAPEAGLRYDGFYDIVLYSFQRLSWDESIFRVVVEFERCMGQRPMEAVLAVPTPSMLDDWDIYLEVKADSVRRSIGEAWYRESLSKEREEERDRLSWHQVRADEDARRAEEDRRREVEEQRRAQEDARRALEDEKREAQMRKAERELRYLEQQEKIEDVEDVEGLGDEDGKNESD